MKACKVCEKGFTPARPMQTVCGYGCAKRLVTLAKKEQKAADKALTKSRRDALRPMRYWEKQAQQAFNAWVRHRDLAKPCISCGCWQAKQWHAGHYLSTGARPELRFDPDNVHKQCSQCNDHKSGNVALYRAGLMNRLGRPVVERLEGPHAPARLRSAELQAIRDHYRARLKAREEQFPLPLDA